MFSFFLLSRPIGRAAALGYILADAASTGVDPAEARAIFRRATTAGDDGEFARDDLSNFCDRVEIVAP